MAQLAGVVVRRVAQHVTRRSYRRQKTFSGEDKAHKYYGIGRGTEWGYPVTGGFITVFEITGGNTALPGSDRLTYLAIGIGALTAGVLLLVLRVTVRGRFRIRLFPAVFLTLWGLA